jgi:spore germination protein
MICRTIKTGTACIFGLAGIAAAVLSISACATPSEKAVPDNSAASIPDEAADTRMKFRELWGYVIAGRENELAPETPLSDIGYFSADVTSYGELDTVPDRTKLLTAGGRVHLVTSCESRSLTHFILVPGSDTRKKLTGALVAATAPFDGLQVDYELVPARDSANFVSFLADLKKQLPDKILSVALPARTRTIPDDIYPYDAISAVVDRVIIMAYDEHWSGGAPGPIASGDWCRKVAAYAQTVIPPEKLVMGIPFYGRTWGNDTTANRAWYYSGTNRIMQENGVHHVNRDPDGIPYYSFRSTQTVTGWYEDSWSLRIRCSQYTQAGITALAFWRVGQEDPLFWQYVGLGQ